MKITNVERRTLLAAIAILGSGGVRTAQAQSHLVSDRLCIGDDPRLHTQTPDQLQAHLNTFSNLDFGMLRVSIGGYGIHPNQDTPDLLQHLAFIRQAIASGFKLKLQVGSWSSPPREVLTTHPEAKILNGFDESPPALLSPWYPNLKALLRQQAEAFFTYVGRVGLTEAVTVLIADLGPAGEPIYPAGWILGKPSSSESSFWFYDQYAQAAFGQDMQARYSDLGRANRRWGTSFKNWASVQIPTPKTHPGAMWEDVLIWYRDAKRAIVRFQVETLKSMVVQHCNLSTPPQIVLLVPGSHLRSDEIRQAIETGNGDNAIKVMVDTEFILDIASDQDCSVQYTGAENEAEIEYLQKCIRLRGYKLTLWAENAGGRPALNPDHLADVILRNNLYGLDYINSNTVFEEDGVTENNIMPELRHACARLLKVLPTRNAM